MSKVSTKYQVHPVTNMKVYEIVYQNIQNPMIRGFLIGTAAEIQDGHAPDVETWKYVYTAYASPRTWDAYTTNDYRYCWAQESSPGGDLLVIKDVGEFE